MGKWNNFPVKGRNEAMTLSWEVFSNVVDCDRYCFGKDVSNLFACIRVDREAISTQISLLQNRLDFDKPRNDGIDVSVFEDEEGDGDTQIVRSNQISIRGHLVLLQNVADGTYQKALELVVGNVAPLQGSQVDMVLIRKQDWYFSIKDGIPDLDLVSIFEIKVHLPFSGTEIQTLFKVECGGLQCPPFVLICRVSHHIIPPVCHRCVKSVSQVTHWTNNMSE